MRNADADADDDAMKAQLGVPNGGKVFKCSNVQLIKCSNVPMFKCSNVPMFKCPNTQMSQSSNVLMLQCSNFQCSNVKIFQDDDVDGPQAVVAETDNYLIDESEASCQQVNHQ